MNRVATLATAEKEKAIGEHTSIVQMPPERNEPSCLGGGVWLVTGTVPTQKSTTADYCKGSQRPAEGPHCSVLPFSVRQVLVQVI